MKPVTDQSIEELNENLTALCNQNAKLIQQLIDKGEIQLAGDLLNNYMTAGRVTQMLGMKTIAKQLGKLT